MGIPDADVAKQISAIRLEEFSIIRLSEPIFTSTAPTAPKRSSDASADADENPTPASLAADLAHYREYFSKLRFSYLEQVTKEKFLRAIIGDPPQVVEHQENVKLEQQLVAVKADLKAQKEEVAGMVEELERKGRELAQRHENIVLQATQLSELPSEIKALEESIASLETKQKPASSNPDLSLPLPATMKLVAARESELEELNAQLKALEQAYPRKTRELERVGSELRPLEAQRSAAFADAMEARRRKDDGDEGISDALELKGRWYRAANAALQETLDVRG